MQCTPAGTLVHGSDWSDTVTSWREAQGNGLICEADNLVFPAFYLKGPTRPYHDALLSCAQAW